jgi:hypothetical protein
VVALLVSFFMFQIRKWPILLPNLHAMRNAVRKKTTSMKYFLLHALEAPAGIIEHAVLSDATANRAL